MANWVNFRITSHLSGLNSEKRFDSSLSGAALKGKLELITGTSTQWQKLELYNKDDQFVTGIEDDSILQVLGVQDGWRIHVIDTEPNKKVGEFEDVSQVEKYELKEEEYDKREDSVRAFMKRNKVGKFSAEAAEAEEKAKQKEDQETGLATHMKVGDRCEVAIPNHPKQRGCIAYVGEVSFKPNCWIGIIYDEPVGKHDGCVQGKRYFTTKSKYGGFVRPSQVTVGDFPEDLINFDDDEI